MSMLLKKALLLFGLVSLAGCVVVPVYPTYSEPRVRPYYVVPAPHVAPYPYYYSRPYYGHPNYGHHHRH